MVKFATQEWADAYVKALNANQNYAEAAGPSGFPPNGWEGDFVFVFEPSGPLDHTVYEYIGLYHGECTEYIYTCTHSPFIGCTGKSLSCD